MCGRSSVRQLGEAEKYTDESMNQKCLSLPSVVVEICKMHTSTVYREPATSMSHSVSHPLLVKSCHVYAEAQQTMFDESSIVEHSFPFIRGF